MKINWVGAALLGLAVTGVWITRYSDAQTTASQVQIEERDGFRTITSNGIPDHEAGPFPNAGNPHRIGAQRHSYRMTLTPQKAENITRLERGAFGVVLNGIPFDPGTAEWWNDDPNSGWRLAARAGTNDLGLDASNAHVQPNGTYHYHGLPFGWLKRQPGEGKNKVTLTGWAADGFPIYSLYGYTNANDAASKIIPLHSSYRLKQGTRPNGPGGVYDGNYEQDYEYVAGSGELDECNGRSGVTPEFPGGTYYYVLTEEYPFVPRAFRGTPDASFTRRPPGGGGQRPGRPPGRGPGRPDHRPPFGPPPPRF